MSSDVWVAGADDAGLAFADDLAANLDAADATYARINAGIDAWIDQQGIEAPPAEPYAPVWQPGPNEGTALAWADGGVRSVIWATGFRPDWSWVDLPWLDPSGYPITSAASRRPTGSTCSACPGCTPGAQAGSRRSTATPPS